MAIATFSKLINTLRETSRALCQQSEKWGEEWPPTESCVRIHDSTWLAVLTDEASIHIQLIAASCKQPIHLHPSL